MTLYTKTLQDFCQHMCVYIYIQYLLGNRNQALPLHLGQRSHCSDGSGGLGAGLRLHFEVSGTKSRPTVLSDKRLEPRG